MVPEQGVESLDGGAGTDIPGDKTAGEGLGCEDEERIPTGGVPFGNLRGYLSDQQGILVLLAHSLELVVGVDVRLGYNGFQRFRGPFVS